MICPRSPSLDLLSLSLFSPDLSPFPTPLYPISPEASNCVGCTQLANEIFLFWAETQPGPGTCRFHVCIHQTFFFLKVSLVASHHSVCENPSLTRSW
jgi:hypothetical protein